MRYNIVLEVSEKSYMFEAYLIFAVCMFGCAGVSWHLGRRVGIENAVSYLVDQGVLDVEEDS